MRLEGSRRRMGCGSGVKGGHQDDAALVLGYGLREARATHGSHGGAEPCMQSHGRVAARHVANGHATS
jgi:hypothetical protein